VSRLRSLGTAFSSGASRGLEEALTSYRCALLVDPVEEAAFERAFAVADSVPGWFDRVAAASFWAVVHDLRPSTVLEIGSYLGRSTVFTAEALRHAGLDGTQLHAVDPHTGDRQLLDRLGLARLPTLDLFRVFLSTSGNAGAVRIHVTRSADLLPDWTTPLDLLFVDGWHEYQAVLTDVGGFGAHLSPRGVVCVDDVDAYEEVDRASREAIAALGLTHYGTIAGKAWAGRAPQPPVSLRRALRLQRRLAAVRRPGAARPAPGPHTGERVGAGA
jgi:MMP 1-O-methyltransferase